MNVLGNKIRTVRESRNISQQELAKDLCRENVIQTIELKNRCDSQAVFTAICSRLDLEVEECLEYTDDQRLSLLLDKIEIKCSNLQHQEAHQLLSNYKIGEVQQNIETVMKYNYYKGVTALLGIGNIPLAQSYLSKVLEYGDNVNVYSILSVNGLGVLYETKGDMQKAERYNKKSLQLIESYFGELIPAAYKIYYNVARFYSEIKEYQNAIDICEKGIALNEEKNTFNYLEHLYYELGFNKYMIGKSAILEYKTAYYLAKHLKNTKLTRVILEDAQRYGLPFDIDENGLI